ncbi:unnamed protein product [Pleuronectes platessa]|uniref:Uncharacterized protein n=1 Tax=Pleuronectes platessa TaxID=8262 RepID=A0A9N7UKZ0_PLEPL|nr:unnamed protein product [Pleuronectes platessa]
MILCRLDAEGGVRRSLQVPLGGGTLGKVSSIYYHMYVPSIHPSIHPSIRLSFVGLELILHPAQPSTHIRGSINQDHRAEQCPEADHLERQTLRLFQVGGLVWRMNGFHPAPLSSECGVVPVMSHPTPLPRPAPPESFLADSTSCEAAVAKVFTQDVEGAERMLQKCDRFLWSGIRKTKQSRTDEETDVETDEETWRQTGRRSRSGSDPDERKVQRKDAAPQWLVYQRTRITEE